MEVALSNDELSRQFSATAFALSTQRQLIKDFGTVGIDFPETFASTPWKLNEVIELLASELSSLETNRTSVLPQLLYQIDVPERLVAELSADPERHAQLAQIILKREAYKVFLRSKFSS